MPRRLQVFLRGGLGNQLFQYSTGLYVATEFGRDLVLRTDLLPIEADKIGDVSRWKEQISEFQHSGVLSHRCHQPRSATNLVGKTMQLARLLGDATNVMPNYLGWISNESGQELPESKLASIRVINSYATFKNLAMRQKARLTDQIRAVRNPTKNFYDLQRELASAPTICVHLRLGDYEQLGHVFGRALPEYYQHAVAKLREHSPARSVWLFSDKSGKIDDAFIRGIAPDRIVSSVEVSRPIENLLLLSKGAGLVASNSTFSWWASFLSEENVRTVAPFNTSAKVNNFEPETDSSPNLEFIYV